MLNLVCRSSELRQSATATLKLVFRHVASVKLPEDVNETIYCFPSTSTEMRDGSATAGAVSAPSVEHLQSVLRTSQQQNKSFAGDLLSVVAKLESLKWL